MKLSEALALALVTAAGYYIVKWLFRLPEVDWETWEPFGIPVQDEDGTAWIINPDDPTTYPGYVGLEETIRRGAQ